MSVALLRPSGVVSGSTNPYVTFFTMWSSAAVSTSISVSSDSTVATPYCGASFVAVGSLTNDRRCSSSAFWCPMMTPLSVVSFRRSFISCVRA
jgi:hypothetical protein